VQTGNSHWVFESAEPETRTTNATDKRFFWLALYAQPALWVALAVVAIVRLRFIWLSLVGMWAFFSPSSTVHAPASLWVGGMPFGCMRRLLTRLAVIAMVLTITNTLAFSRCDKFSQASTFATRAFNTGGLAGTLGSAMLGRFFR